MEERRRSRRGASQQEMVPSAPRGNGMQYAAMTQSSYQSGAQGGRRGGKGTQQQGAKKGGRAKWVALGAVMIIVMALVIGGTCAFIFLQNLNGNLHGTYSDEQMTDIQEKLVPVTNIDEPFYAMIIGSDERSDDAEMGARADSNILVRVDPVNWVVTMISIPRDTKITFNGSTIKFNSAYTYGGGAAGSIQAASELCGVSISHFAEIDFGGVVSLVDALGGVEVDVPQPINDPQAGWVTIDNAGLQTLSGAQALVFARSRHYYVDGDFSRSANQRALIEAVVNKVFSKPVSELPGLVQQISKCLSTDMDVNALYSLAMQYANSGKQMTIYNIMVPSTTAEIDGASYVIADTEGLAEIMEVVNAGGDPNTVVTSGATGGNFEHYDYIEEDESDYGY